MTYMQQFEAELAEKLKAADDETLIKWVCEKALESYKKGITAGKNGAQVIRKGQSRRTGFSAQARQSRA